ncbi:hypothetical protein [Rufibacter latericius]|uniref:Uncharacterized protein n=1 Tax=Rufibacter latericius TaxID=2487040 RepID=A0A3M9M970_9BACT|nr:hypothetical protein [Rufibacter latericius]RNI22036.1 hypothetical protein EFB08_23170 [Rufibacter latericius]
MAILTESDLAPKSDLPVAKAQHIKGAPQNKASKAELDAVPTHTREAGQIGKVTVDPDPNKNGSYTMSTALAWVKDTVPTSTTDSGYRWHGVPNLSVVDSAGGGTVAASCGSVVKGTAITGTAPTDSPIACSNCAPGNWRDDLVGLHIM